MSVAPAVQPARLFVEHDGVAFSLFPSHKRLTQSLQVSITAPHISVGWGAQSDASWLVVTKSGRTGGYLTLTAKPAGLKKDVLYTATVTVMTGSLGIKKETQTVRVSLWIGSTDPGVVTTVHAATAITANPVEPWVYVSSNGPNIDVFNVYTGALVKTFARVAPTVGAMVLSSNGSDLFAADTTNYKILRLDPASGATLATYDLTGPIDADFSFDYARPAARPTLFAAGQGAIDVQTGQIVSAPITNGYPWGFYDPMLKASADGSRLIVVERGLSPGSLYSWGVTAAVAGTGVPQLTVTPIANATIPGENCQALAISPDGSTAYPACGAPYEFDVFDVETLQQVQTLYATAYPNNAAIDSNGDFVGGLDGLYDASDVYVFDPTGFLLEAVPALSQGSADGQQDDALATSGDSRRVITATGAVYDSTQTLMFRNLP